MKCPYCGFTDSRVIDSRPADDDLSIRRRRECLSCGKRFTTFETIEHVQLVVIKRDGSRQAFDRSKILNGLLKSCEKRPVTAKQMEDIADEIEQQLQNRLTREVESREIGELVMDRLREVDEIAYIRFASVYRQFQDLSSFVDELNALLQKTATRPPDSQDKA